MKTPTLKFLRIPLLFLALMGFQSAFAQQAVVSVTLNVLPPYSPFYRDYAGFNRDYGNFNMNNTIVTLLSGTQAQVYLTASIASEDNSISIRVKDSYRPDMPVNLVPNIPQTLTGIQLKNLYGSGDVNDLVLTGLSEREIVYNQALPEGNYLICVQAHDYATGLVLGESCRNIYVAYYEPPQIISPANLSSTIATTPQFLLTSWTPVTPNLTGIRYRLRIAKLVPGVTSTDALLHSTQIILDRPNIIAPNFILDPASGVILDTGYAYALQVTAAATNAYFKNNGESDPVTFYYKANPYLAPGTEGISLNFIRPSSNKPYVEVNNETPMLISWNWFDPKISSDTLQLNDTLFKKYGVVRYKIRITNASKGLSRSGATGTTLYTGEINLKNNNLRSYLSLSKKAADSIGFVDQGYYKATVEAWGETSNLIATAHSVNFQYRKIPDAEPSLNIPVSAVLHYVFSDSLNSLYYASNTPFVVEVLRKAQGPLSAVPTVTIGGTVYYPVAKTTGNTNALGAFHDQVSVPLKVLTGDSLYFKVSLPDPYYIDKDLPIVAIPAVNKDTLVNFGSLVAGTYGYSLKLYVKKLYTSYKISEKSGSMNVSLADSVFNADEFPYQYSSENGGTMTYAVESIKPADGITVVMYRKNKQTYIPPVEGNLTDYSHTTGYTEVGRGVTHIEKRPEGDVTSVTFDHLLASVFNGDEYYILALNGKNAPDQGSTGTPAPGTGFVPNLQLMTTVLPGQQAFQHYNAPPAGGDQLNVSQQLALEQFSQPQYEWSYSFNPYINAVFSEDGFVAEEMPFKLSLPLNTNHKDSLYRHVEAHYDIVSSKPPTSLVSGRLMYHWKSDPNGQLRPLANAPFKIVVDYLVNGKPIGSIRSISGSGGSISIGEKFFVPEGQDVYDEGMELLDHNATMAVGKTDEQGNFVLDVVNINQKGSLGKGYVVEKGWTFDNYIEGEQMPGELSFDDLINPGNDDYGFPGSLGIDFNNNMNNGVQNMINGNMNVGFNSNMGSFDVGFVNPMQNGGGMFQPGMHGPARPEDEVTRNISVTYDNELVEFQRVYRIVPDNQYLYPAKETFAVDAFEALNISEPQKSYVKEVKVRIHSIDNNKNNLDQMVVTVFRDISDKTPDLPLGEGNGEYKVTELVSPQYQTTGEPIDVSKAGKLNPGGNIFDKKFEILWPATPDSANGWVGFTTLLAGYGFYYAEACSDPTGSRSYKATFSAINTEIDDFNPDYWYGTASPPPIELTLTLQPLPSRALIRLMDNTTQQGITGAMGGRVTLRKEGTTWNYTSWVDNEGYVEFIADRSPLSYFASPVKFTATANGYRDLPANSTVKFTFDPTGDQFIYHYMLDPALRMQGHIVNQDQTGKPGVPSYIKVTNGKVIETDAQGYFSNLPVPAVAGTRILIIPKDVGFFDSAYVITAQDAAKQTVNISDFGVYRRKHRIRFTITNDNNQAIANATVQLGDSIRKTSYFGKALFSFENVSVNNFTFIIRGPEGQNYIPKTLNVKNTESKDYVNVTVKLATGSMVQGKVTLDGQPVKNARIYLDVSQQSSLFPPFFQGSGPGPDAGLVEARSDANGNYVLHGVPVNNQQILLHATLDTTFTVNGDLQPANIQNHSAVTNFSLSGFRKMLINNLYGFPVTTEKIVPITPDSSQVKVTAVIHWSEAISDFSLEEATQVLRIEDVIYKAETVNGKKVGIPQSSSVPIEGVTALKFRYLNHYNVKLKAVQPGGTFNLLYPEPLYVSKENDLGVIKGRVSIVDNSFNYPSTYLNFSSALNSFYLAEKTSETSVNTAIGAVTSAMTETQTNNGYYQNYANYISQIHTYIYQHQSQPQPRYYLSNESGDSIRFKLIEFNATADPLKSFIDTDGKIHLNVNLSCHIPNAQPENFRLNIEDMVLDDNKVYPASSSSPINLSLEKWTLKIRNWSFSTQEGGIVSNNGLINTSAIDIPFTKFVLRHDLFLMDQFQLQQLKMAGGGITLQNINTTNAAIVFDSKTGMDMKPHWRFSISGNPAAQLPPLKDLSGTIKLNYIQILSNNESVFQLQQQSAPMKIRSNDLAMYSAESIFNGPDYISIAGGLNVGAPRMGDIALRLKYKDPNNLTLESVETDFEGQGFVHFVARNPGNNIPNITIDPKQITILGNVVEKPVKTFNEIPSTFYAIVGGNPVYRVEMQKDFITQLDKDGNTPGSKGHKLQIASGGMSVTGGDWSVLSYEGNMTSNTADTNTKPCYMKFTVMGDISASSDKLEVSNINTPFGDLKMVFDFPNKRLIGKLTAKNIPLGTNTLTGTIETLFDPEGFYISGGCSADVKLPNPYVDGTYNMGFMVGSYPVTNELWDVVNSYKNPAVKNDCYRIKNPKLTGFYFTIDRIIIDKSIDFDFILASGYVHATALLGADVYANFGGSFTAGVEAHAYANVAAGLGSITGTSISGNLDALALLKFIYANGKFNADGSIDLGFQASITQSLVLTTISKSIDISCHAAGGTSGFSFSLGSGDPKQDCGK